ncbi:hypothetical protein AJ80_05551 [Polytolypa hystricis UAMH7299]|uniref:Methyltransferase domain-containing protein n=1 Tax=Polytolypa hystricis (strain UAMH7299) TaxID=1447883 RepID=A0A2B7Y3X1_POLH7|nr:hypothetical protein AJ80_05551 [Polytolypa hystricis UAMH7299]
MKDTPTKEYVMGHEGDEVNRLRQQHLWLKHSMPQLILAPVDKSRPNLRILDSGTADGTWLFDISTGFSEASYVGTDIAAHLFPVAPPENMTFKIQSIKDPWPEIRQSSFDLVHQRLVLACCDEAAAKVAVRRLVELAKPGGWIQLMECDHSGGFAPEVAAQHPALVKFGELVISHLAGKGQCGQQGLHLKRLLADSGVVDIKEAIYDMPVGVSAENAAVGEVAAGNLIEVAKKMQGGDQFVEELIQELNTIGGTQRFHAVYGQRPLGTV